MLGIFERLLVILFFCVGLFGADIAAGESTTSTIIGGGGRGGVEDGARYQVDPSLIKNDMSSVEMNGREYKYHEAGRLSDQGKAAATSAGAGYVAAAIPLLPGIFTHPIGVRLLNKGMIEFKQAAASGAVANTNFDHEKRVRAEAGQSGSQQTGDGSGAGGNKTSYDAGAELKSNKSLQEYLTQKGINSDDFIDRMVSGQISDTDDLLRSLGETSLTRDEVNAPLTEKEIADAGLTGKITPDVKSASADGKSDAKATAGGGGGNGNPTAGTVGNGNGSDVRNGSGTALSGTAGPGGSGAKGVATNGGAPPGGGAAAGRSLLGAAGTADGAASGPGGRRGRRTANGGDEESDVDEYGQKLSPAVLAQRAKLAEFLRRKQLETVGVLPPHGNGIGGVFMTARGSYRAFRGWRTKLAQSKAAPSLRPVTAGCAAANASDLLSCVAAR